MGFFLATQKRVRNSRGKRAINVRSSTVHDYNVRRINPNKQPAITNAPCHFFLFFFQRCLTSPLAYGYSSMFSFTCKRGNPKSNSSILAYLSAIRLKEENAAR